MRTSENDNAQPRTCESGVEGALLAGEHPQRNTATTFGEQQREERIRRLSIECSTARALQQRRQALAAWSELQQLKRQRRST